MPPITPPLAAGSLTASALKISPRKKKIASVSPSIAETRAGVCAPCFRHHAYSPKYIYPTARNNKTADKHNSRTHDAQNLIPSLKKGPSYPKRPSSKRLNVRMCSLLRLQATSFHNTTGSSHALVSR
ncbi:unnamed protein product, partial [Ectocarpus sp. 12 AP-2014]